MYTIRPLALRCSTTFDNTRISCHLIDQDGLLVHVADDGLTDRLKPPSTTARAALVAEARPKHRVAATAEHGLRHEAQRRADLAAGVVVVAGEQANGDAAGEEVVQEREAGRVLRGLQLPFVSPSQTFQWVGV